MSNFHKLLIYIKYGVVILSLEFLYDFTNRQSVTSTSEQVKFEFNYRHNEHSTINTYLYYMNYKKFL